MVTRRQMYTLSAVIAGLIIWSGAQRGKQLKPRDTYPCGHTCHSQVRHNMHKLQKMAGQYAARHGGAYPPSVAELEKAALQAQLPYWQELKNPYTGQAAFVDGPPQSTPPLAGCAIGSVIYIPQPKGYSIYGCGKDKLLRAPRGKVMVLEGGQSR